MSSRRVRAEFAAGSLAFPRGVRESALGVGTKTLNLLEFVSLVLGKPEWDLNELLFMRDESDR